MIDNNIVFVSDRIRLAAERVGRQFPDITLVAVSKTVGTTEIMQAYQAGIRNFGENKAQEMRQKAEELPGDICWHFIGHLQTNKVKYVVGTAEYIHSVDSARLLEEIIRLAEKQGLQQKILLEVKTSDEESKYGIESDMEISRMLELAFQHQSVQICGFMTMAPFTDDEALIRRSFRHLRQLRDQQSDRLGYQFPILSMGMSGDFEIAIEEGSTLVRVGTSIFGERHYR